MNYVIITIYFIGSFLVCSSAFIGKYTYSQNGSYESIELNAGFQFVYEFRNEFIYQRINGMYNIIEDSLFLNSFPQRDKLIVREKFKKSKKLFFKVRSKDDDAINYHLHLTTEDGDILRFEDCFDITKIKERNINRFYIIDTKGLRSPEYFIQGERSNFFDITFESIRVFENERWYIDKVNNEIKPIGLDGEPTKYYLKKK